MWLCGTGGLLCKLVLCNALSLTEDLKENVGQGNSEAPAGTILCPKSFRGKTKETRYVSNCVAASYHLHCKSPLTTIWHLVKVRGAMISRVWASVGCVKIGMLVIRCPWALGRLSPLVGADFKSGPLRKEQEPSEWIMVELSEGSSLERHVSSLPRVSLSGSSVLAMTSHHCHVLPLQYRGRWLGQVEIWMENNIGTIIIFNVMEDLILCKMHLYFTRC